MAIGTTFDTIWVPRLDAAFLRAFEGALGAGWAMKVGKYKPDVSEFTKDVERKAQGNVKKVTGPLTARPNQVYTQTVQTFPYSVTETLNKFDMRRDEKTGLGIWTSEMAEAGEKCAQHWDLLGVNLLASNPNCFDGTALFGNAHPRYADTGLSAQINDVSSAQIATLATAGGTPTAPTIVDCALALPDCLTYFATLTDEAGHPINGMARKFILITGSAQIYARMIATINSLQITQGQTNPLKGFLDSGYTIDCILDPRLVNGTEDQAAMANATKIFMLFRVDSEVRAFGLYDEFPLMPEYLGPGTDSWVKDMTATYSIQGTRNVFPGRWQHALRCTFS